MIGLRCTIHSSGNPADCRRGRKVRPTVQGCSPMKKRLLAVSMLALLCCGAGWSQDTRGSIVGRITDPSGAVVPGATVVITNPATAAKSTVTTNQDGIYRVPLLQPGSYQIEVTS